MKRLAFIICAIALTGCEKLIKPITKGHTIPPRPKLVVIMGQSNAERLKGWGGYPGWNSVRKTNDLWLGCGEAGTSTYDWEKDKAPMRRCLEELNDLGRKPDIILWYQGEADAQQGWAAGYEQRTIALFRSWRSMWGNVPIIYAQLGSYNPVTWPAQQWDEIKDIQAHMSYPNSIMVKTDDINPGSPTTGGDGIHYTEEGNVELARRFAVAYEQLLAGE